MVGHVQIQEKKRKLISSVYNDDNKGVAEDGAADMRYIFDLTREEPQQESDNDSYY
jgi:hypothetical protein